MLNLVVIRFNMSLLSVVTITFNDSENLLRTRESLDLKQIRWIVIDGSQESEAKAKNQIIAKNACYTFVQEPDTGIFNAMNKGLSLVDTPLVTFLNSGDLHASKDVVSMILKSYEENGWNWAVGQTVAIDNSRVRLWEWPMPDHTSLKFKLSIRAFSHQATVYETDFIKKIGGYYEESIYSDWLLSLKMAKIQPPRIENKIWCFFTTGGISSQQKVDFWRRECVRLRKLESLQIWRNFILDWVLQYCAATLIKLDRGKFLMRPDLAKKYPLTRTD